MCGLTESNRRDRPAEHHPHPGTWHELEAEYGRVWETRHLSEELEVMGLQAPFVVVRRRPDGVKGLLEFQYGPRLCFNSQPDGSHPFSQVSSRAHSRKSK